MINDVNLKIWGREFTIPISYDNYKDKKIMDSQILALDSFLKKRCLIRKAKSKVEEYCKDAVENDASNEKKDNIFSYVKPECIFVKHEQNPRIAIMCKYKYDMENGLAVVFTGKGEITVGSQNIII